MEGISRYENLVESGDLSHTATVAAAARKEYMLGRNHQSSNRLYTQHWLWNLHLGYLLHPAIPLPKTDTTMAAPHVYTIADIGTGNACWLIELARKLQSQHQGDGVALYGYDISSRMFPNKEDLPVNVELGFMDGFVGLPEEEKKTVKGGGFNVVHLRMIFTIIESVERLQRLLGNMVGMLKPGGYIQWDEMDINTLRVQAPNQMTTTDSTIKILAIWKGVWKKLGKDFGWVSTLPSHFPRDSFEILHTSCIPVSNDLRKAFTDNLAAALDESGVSILQRSTSGGRAEFGISGEEYLELWNRAAEEMLAGVNILTEFRVTVAKKTG